MEREDLPYTYGNAFLFGEFVVAAILAIIFTLTGCATFSVSSSAKDNGVADYGSRGVTASPGGTWVDFAHGVEAIARAKADSAYVGALDASAVWYAQQGVEDDAVAVQVDGHEERITTLELGEHCKDGEREACDALGIPTPATGGAR